MLRLAWDYIKHFFQSKSVYSLHSPFVYTWYQEVLKGPITPEIEEIESFRKKLSRDQRSLQLKDYGAGSSNKGQSLQVQRLGKLVSKASRKKQSGRILYHLCRLYQAQRCLEFGTHVGISSLYQLKALKESQFYSMEGDPQLAAIAKENFTKFDVEVQQFIGEFSEILDQAFLLKDFRPDYVFIDGNHRYAPTLQYFHQLLPHMPDESILVFDDIYWSAEMKKAWQEIIQHEEVSVSIDLFFLGICFIRRKQEKEHFKFRL